MVAIARARETAAGIVRPGHVIHGGDGSCLHGNAAALDALGMDGNAFRSRLVYSPEWFVLDARGRPIRGTETPGGRAILTQRTAEGVIGIRNLRSQRIQWIDVRAEPVFDNGRLTVHVQFGEAQAPAAA